MTEFRCHSEKQFDALFSTTPITCVASGIQWGKTTVGAAWLKILMHTYTAEDDNFIITSPTFPILNQSTRPPFLRAMEGLGHHNRQENNFKMTGGGTCWFRTGRDPDSIVGIPKVRGILCDEAGLYSLYFWENIQGRSDANAAPIMIVTSPYSLNWLYKDIIAPIQKNKKNRQDVTLIQAKSVENPYFNKERYYERQKVMDPRRFNMMYGGEWHRMAGLVYDCFDDVENQCDAFQLPTGTKLYGGIDWGHTHAFVFKIRAVTPSGQHYGIHEFYKSGLTIFDIELALLRLCQVYEIGAIYCDPSQPAHIEQMNRAFHKAGLKAHCLAADNTIRTGIDRHYELLKTRKLKYFKGCNKHTLDELDTYHYPSPEDLKPDQHSKDAVPVKQNDDCLDCDRYLSLALYNGVNRKAPFVPSDQKKEEDIFKRIEQHKRRPKFNRDEKWS